MNDIILSPSDLVAMVNQTLEFAYPRLGIEGELANFKVSKNRWVYFDLMDEQASVRFFGSVYQLPAPLQDGLRVQVVGSPRLHPRFGFSVNFQTIQPVGEGSLKKAADLLASKLETEGLFAPERKRPLPQYPSHIGLITAHASAAYADFMKIINARWGGLTISHMDVLVQGAAAPGQLVTAIERFNQSSSPPEVIVMTRGGGSADDLASFSDERVVRAVAASRIPSVVAIGHEVDISLAELAADLRAATPTDAAGLVVPDKKEETRRLENSKKNLAGRLTSQRSGLKRELNESRNMIKADMTRVLSAYRTQVDNLKNFSRLLDPKAALTRGYAILAVKGRHIRSIADLKIGDTVIAELADGKINSIVKGITPSA